MIMSLKNQPNPQRQMIDMKSLQRQLSVLLGLSILGIFVLFWWFSITTIHQVADDYVLTRLDHDSESVIKNLHLKNGVWSLEIENIEPIYSQPLSGHYFVLKVGNQTFLSPSLDQYPLLLKSWNINETQNKVYETLGPLVEEGNSVKRSKLLVLGITTSKNNIPIQLYVAEDHSPIQESLKYFDWMFGTLALITLLLMYLLQRWILKRTFGQLVPLEKQLKELELTNQFTLESTAYPKEVESLIDALKGALQQAAKQLKTSRQSNANLSHGLKTPLNLAFQLLEQVKIDPSPDNLKIVQQQMQQQLSKIHHLIDRELKKARIASDAPLNNRFDFASDLDELLKTLKQLHPNKTIECRCAIPEVTSLLMEKEDGFELLGNLLDNAFKWAQSTIVLSLTEENGSSKLVIEDDGKGVSDDLLNSLQTRGFRADETMPGHGIGLSIVKDLIEAYSGDMQFNHSDLGGLKVQIIFRPRTL